MTDEENTAPKQGGDTKNASGNLDIESITTAIAGLTDPELQTTLTDLLAAYEDALAD